MIDMLKNLTFLIIGLLIIGIAPVHAQNIDLGGVLNGLVQAVKEGEKGNAPSDNKVRTPSSQNDSAQQTNVVEGQSILETGAQKYWDQLTRIENQLVSLPVTNEGYVAYKNLFSEFYEMTHGKDSLTYIRTITRDRSNQLGKKQNKVAGIFETRKAEFKSIEESVQNERKETSEKEMAALLSKYHAQIAGLGFSDAFLKATIYLQIDTANQPRKFLTFEEWLAAIFESGSYTNITKIRTKSSQGVSLKRAGMQSAGILFKYDNGDLFPSGISDGEKAHPIMTVSDQIGVSTMIINATALSKNPSPTANDAQHDVGGIYEKRNGIVGVKQKGEQIVFSVNSSVGDNACNLGDDAEPMIAKMVDSNRAVWTSSDGDNCTVLLNFKGGELKLTTKDCENSCGIRAVGSMDGVYKLKKSKVINLN